METVKNFYNYDDSINQDQIYSSPSKYDRMNLNSYMTGTIEQKKNFSKQKKRFMPFPVIKQKGTESGEQIIIQGSIELMKPT